MDRVRVVLRALPTYLAIAITVLTVLADEIVTLLPDNVGVQVAAWIAAAIAWCTAVIKVIQRVTPADKDAVGLLPPPEWPRGISYGARRSLDDAA